MSKIGIKHQAYTFEMKKMSPGYEIRLWTFASRGRKLSRDKRKKKKIMSRLPAAPPCRNQKNKE